MVDCKACTARIEKPRCQKAVKIAMILLVVLVLAEVILAMMKASYAKNIATADVAQRIFEYHLTQEQIEFVQGIFGKVALAISVISIIGVLCAISVLLAARYCNQRWKGCVTKFSVGLSSLVFLTIAVIFIIIGAALTKAKGQFNEKFITQQCNYAIAQNY